jgi:hypothetical protein
MDASLLWIMIAVRARTEAVPAPIADAPERLPEHRPERRALRGERAPPREDGSFPSVVLLLWRWLDTARGACAAMMARRSPGRVHLRSGWARALCEVSLVRLKSRP